MKWVSLLFMCSVALCNELIITDNSNNANEISSFEVNFLDFEWSHDSEGIFGISDDFRRIKYFTFNGTFVCTPYGATNVEMIHKISVAPDGRHIALLESFSTANISVQDTHGNILFKGPSRSYGILLYDCIERRPVWYQPYKGLLKAIYRDKTDPSVELIPSPGSIPFFWDKYGADLYIFEVQKLDGGTATKQEYNNIIRDLDVNTLKSTEKQLGNLNLKYNRMEWDAKNLVIGYDDKFAISCRVYDDPFKCSVIYRNVPMPTDHKISPDGKKEAHLR